MNLPAPQPMLGVVVLTYNGLADTAVCLESLEAQAVAHARHARVILVDNGSSDGTADVVRARHPWCDIVRLESNAGPCPGNNAGIERARSLGCDWIVLLNNDTRVTADFLTVMSEAATAAGGRYDIVGPVIHYMNDPDDVMTDGVQFNAPSFPGFFPRVEVPVTAGPLQFTPVDVVNGCCLMARNDVFVTIGDFDASLFIYHDESDLCLRARAAGLKAAVFSRHLVWHKGGKSSPNRGKANLRYFDARNLGILVSRYAGRFSDRRGRLASYAAYLRYCYHRYCSEAEAGAQDAARAVIDGVVDWTLGTRGSRPQRRSWLHRAADGIFHGTRLLRG